MAQEGEYPKSNGDIYYGEDANMAFYQGALAQTLSNAAITVGSTATIVGSANTSRKSILIRNNATDNVFIGNSSVSTSNGFRLLPGESVYFNGNGVTDAIYGIGPTNTQNVRYLETE